MRRFDVWVGRLAAIAGIVYVVLCSLWPLSASSAGTDALDKPGAPYFFVASDDPATARLPPKSTQVDMRIAGVIADGVVTQRYRNEGTRPIEARYVFPGGTRSAVYAMSVRLGDRLLTANIREKQQARVEYEAPDQAVAVDQPSPMPKGVSKLAIGAEAPAAPEPPAIALLLVAFAVIALSGRRLRSVVGSPTGRKA